MPFLLLPLWAKKLAVCSALCGSLLALHYGPGGDLATTRRALAAGAVEINPLGVRGSTVAVWAACGLGFLPVAYPKRWPAAMSVETWLLPASQIPLKVWAIRNNERVAADCLLHPERCENGCALRPEFCP